MDAVYWIGENGHIYTKSSAGVIDQGMAIEARPDGFVSEKQPNGSTSLYSQIKDPAPGGNVAGSGTTTPNVAPSSSGYSAPAKVLDTAQLQSLDSLIASLASIKDQSVKKAGIKRDTSKREKETEKEQEEGKYQGEKLSTLQDFAGAKTDTDLNTRNTLENLISSLSTLGLGGSRALTRQILDAANMSNRKANATQATSNRDLDTAFNEYTAGNENDMKKIEDQYGYDAGEAEKAYLQGKQNALYKKADVYNAVDDTGSRSAIMSEANGLNGLIAGSSFMNPSYTGETKAMETPELGTYTQDIAKYDTTGIGANSTGLTPVAAGATNMPGNLAVRAIAVNDKDLGIKKKTENELGYGV